MANSSCMDIEEIKTKIRSNEYEISYHAERERREEEITINHIEVAILNGEILEDYADDPRGSSCLVLGYSAGKSVHVVCGWSEKGWLRIITVYVPKPPKWLDRRTRAKRGE